MYGMTSPAGRFFCHASDSVTAGLKCAPEHVHRVELRGIDDEPAILARHDEVRVGQLFQVERERRWRHA
jgi:hypothetical protein